MPTGYTADVGDGKVTAFKDFALICARAFGACIELRDEPLSAGIPDRFKVDDHYAARVKEAAERIKALRAMSDTEIAAARDTAEASRVDTVQRMNREALEKKTRYEAMLADVAAWTPPTADHVEMKKFMTDQLNESIRFDCGDYSAYSTPMPSASEWYDEELKRATKAYGNAVTDEQDAITRAHGRSKWVKDLKASLA